MKKILVVGGAGYIGSHLVRQLSQAQQQVIVLDDLSNGHAESLLGAELIKGNVGNIALLDEIFRTHDFDAVIHFASFIEVGESLIDPGKYYRNNVGNTLVLLDAMVKHGIANFVFSSTAAIFGEPRYTPIDESHPAQPINPYGQTKLIIEQALENYDRAYGLKSVCLRYFNAAGASPDAAIGERHSPETHLIPLVLQVASGRRENIKIFGSDYPTPDGSCIRDYIHVEDLCTAHSLALAHLRKGGCSERLNLGNGAGYSVKQVIASASHLTGIAIPVIEQERRLGDPAILVADSSRAREILAWEPKYSSLESIVTHAWQWEQVLASHYQ